MAETPTFAPTAELVPAALLDRPGLVRLKPHRCYRRTHRTDNQEGVPWHPGRRRGAVVVSSGHRPPFELWDSYSTWKAPSNAWPPSAAPTPRTMSSKLGWRARRSNSLWEISYPRRQYRAARRTEACGSAGHITRSRSAISSSKNHRCAKPARRSRPNATHVTEKSNRPSTDVIDPHVANPPSTRGLINCTGGTPNIRAAPGVAKLTLKRDSPIGVNPAPSKPRYRPAKIASPSPSPHGKTSTSPGGAGTARGLQQ